MYEREIVLNLQVARRRYGQFSAVGNKGNVSISEILCQDMDFKNIF